MGDLKKSTSPSDKFSRDWSEKAGDNEEEDNDVEWSGDEEEQQGGNVNAVPRDGNKLELDSTLQLNRRASPREGIKLEHILNFRGGFHDEEEPRKQSNSDGDGDLWERIMCSFIIVVAYFIEMMRMRMRMENKNEDEVIYFCRIGTNNLYFMCFEFASPFRLRTFRKQQHGSHNNTTQQPPPLPPKVINNNHTPTQHTAVSNQQKIAAIAGKETRWIQPLLRGAADMAVLRYEMKCEENVNAEPRIVDGDDAAGECSSKEQSIICSSTMVYRNVCIVSEFDNERAIVNGGAHGIMNISAVNADCILDDIAHDNCVHGGEIVVDVHVYAHMYREIAVQMVPRVVQLLNVERKWASDEPTDNDPSFMVQAYTTNEINCTPHPTERQPIFIRHVYMMTHQPSLLPSANPSAFPTHWPTGMSVYQQSPGIPSEEPTSQMPTEMPTVYESNHRPTGIQIVSTYKCLSSPSSSSSTTTTTTTTTTEVERIDVRGVRILFLAASKNILAGNVASDSNKVDSGSAVLRGVPASDSIVFVNRCVLVERIVKAVKFMAPRFEVKGAEEYSNVYSAPSLLSCSMVQYCVSEFSGGISREESRSDMPCDHLNGMCYESRIGARSAKSSVCMANDGLNREPTLVPRMAPPSLLWKNAIVLPWEWHKKHPLMASYSRKGLPPDVFPVPVPVEVEEPCERLYVPSPSILLFGEVSFIVGILSNSCPTILPSGTPKSSPSSFERRVMYFWQRNLPRDEEIFVPSSNSTNYSTNSENPTP